MNERIEKLLAELDIDLYTDEGVMMTGILVRPKDLRQFAELIVRECADLFVDQKYMILNPHEPFANERVRALKEHDKDTVRKIKGHFGVEE